MNPRERILAALHHEPPDRTPTDGWFHPEVTRRLLREYQTDDWSIVLADLGIEGWTSLGPDLAFPEFEKRAQERPGGRSGQRAVWRDERTFEELGRLEERRLRLGRCAYERLIAARGCRHRGAIGHRRGQAAS
jgi:hypothetical protein